MSRAVQAPPVSLAVLVALSNVARATPPVAQAREPMNSTSFKCNGSIANDLHQCFGPENGMCESGSRCFMRETYKTHKLIASCCCNTTTTPVESVLHNWSCWVDYNDGKAARGGRPFCNISCCKRPSLSRACHGNGPICCDESKQCGVNTNGDACCAPRPGAAPDPHCSATLGRTCGWVHTSWLTLLMPSKQCLVGSQANCQEHCKPLTRGLLVTALSALVAACSFCIWLEQELAARARNWLEQQEQRSAVGRRALTQVLILLATALLMLLSARWAGHAWGMCLLWAASLLALALLPGLLWHRTDLLELLHPQEPQEQSSQNTGVVWLAIRVNLEDYDFWPHVEDKRMEELGDLLTERGWTVPPVWRNLKNEDFDSLIRYVRGIIKNSFQPRVLICISCHSQMVFGIPHILPVEAGKCCWWRSVPIYHFMYQLGRTLANSAHFAIIVNGCLDSPGCWQRLASRTSDATVQLCDTCRPYASTEEATFYVLFATVPGRQARGTWLTEHLLTFLRSSNSDNLQQLFEYVQSKLGLQRPFVMTTAGPADFSLTPTTSPCSSAESLQHPLQTSRGVEPAEVRQ